MISIKRECAEMILDAGVMKIRDVDDGEEPFSYTSGHKGPGYVSIKNLVGRTTIIRRLAYCLAKELQVVRNIKFVAGNATGGIIPGWLLSEFLAKLFYKAIPFVFVKEGQLVGVDGNPEISFGDSVVVVDELVNFASTTCETVQILRNGSYEVKEAACILYYGNPEADKRLAQMNVRMTYLLSLSELLDHAEWLGIYPICRVNSYRAFLRDPIEWQKNRGLLP